MREEDAVLKRLRSMDASAVVNEMLRCCGSKAWCESIARLCPFDDRASLHIAADVVFENLTQADWLEAFEHHPKIGDIDSLRMKFSGNREWSAGEQAGAVDVGEATLFALAKGNAAYEEKFGFIFIVCATGKSAREMLAMLQLRLQNDRQTEIKIAADEQRKITHLRIGKWGIEA